MKQLLALLLTFALTTTATADDWIVETVDSDDDVGKYTSLALDSAGHPRISYYDYDKDYLKYAATRPDWDIDNVELTADAEDGGVMVGWTPTGDTPAGVRVLRGEIDPVAVSGSLPGGTTRWLDRGVEPGGSYAYWLEATDADGHTERYGPTESAVVPELERVLTLDAPWPNPAADGVSLSFELPSCAGEASITIYDLAGRIVETIGIATAPGRQTFSLDTTAYQPGVYLATLATDTGSETRRFVISR